MNALDQTYQLAEDVSLRLPPTFEVKIGDAAITAIERSTGALVTAFVKPSPKGLPPDRLAASVLALAKKKHPELAADGEPQTANGTGWSGQTQLYRTARSILAPTRLIVTCAILPAPDPTQQRNLAVMVEVSDEQFIERLMYFRRLAETRVRVGTELTLQPMVEPSPTPANEPEIAPLETAATPPIASHRTPTSPLKSRQRKPEPTDDHEMLASAARGQRTLAISILLTFLARGIVNNPEVPALAALAVSIAVLMYALSGVVKLCTGFGYSTPRKLVFMFFSTVPLLNIGLWIYLSVKTTRRLRAAGYTVGLFGART